MKPALKPRSSYTPEKLSFWSSILYLFIPLFSVAQSSNSALTPLRKSPTADAMNAIEIKDSIAGPFNVSLGFGKIKEINPAVKLDPIEENNSVWFKLNIKYDTLLTFDIVPFDSLDDYDFVLFRCTSNVCIDSNGRGIFKKVRSCLSVCSSKSGMTGLSEYSFDAEISSGKGPAYVRAVRVKAGETYYLMVNYGNYYILKNRQPAGFRIYFYNYFPKPQPIVLSNIFFETGNALLTKESFPALNELAEMLRSNQSVIEIRGHTDNTGNEQANKQLSEDRAKAVRHYLVSRQINEKRIFYKGFGSSKPIASNTTNEGRQKNRRVEFVKVIY